MRLKIIIVAMMSCLIAAAHAQQPIYVEVDGSRVYFSDVQPKMVNGRVFVPIRGIFERLGAQVGWSDWNQTVTVSKPGMDISLRIGDSNAIVNGNQVWFDAPARIERGRTLVPIRFLSETLGASVNWDASMNTVRISTESMVITDPPRGMPTVMAFLISGTVVPFTLDNRLSSNNSVVGDKFTATIDTRGQANYLGLPRGTKIEGYVDLAQPKGSNPGALGITCENFVLPDGRKIACHAQVISLDEKNVRNENGKLVATTSARQEGHRFVWIGAGGGALLSLITKSNIITGTILGAALGFIYDEILRGQRQSNDVVLAPGTSFGVRLEQDLTVYK